MHMPSPKDLFHTAIVLILSVSVGAGQVPTASPSPEHGSKVWIGHYAEYEEFLRTAVVDRTIDMGAATRVFFKPGGLAASAALKQHSPELEIAGYKLDRVLELDMVPPTVEVRYEGKMAGRQLWVLNCRALPEVNGGYSYCAQGSSGGQSTCTLYPPSSGGGTGCNPDCPTDPTGVSWKINDHLFAQANPGPPTGSAPENSKPRSSKTQIRSFLRFAENGEFDNKVVHMDSDSPIARALISDVPISHWGSWTVNFREKPEGGYTKSYTLKTKGGHTVKIVLDE
jgi:hypothetical protein